MEPPSIGFWGGMALLISSITGPGLTTIPLLFQQAGWLTPTLAFLVFGVISGTVSLLLVETMSAIRGNERFQSRVEYATVAHLYLGNRSHYIMQILLFCALQSVNLSSIIISEQTMDSLLITLFHKTCALSFTEGAVCVSKINPSGSPFNSYILASLGYLVSAAMVIPLSMMTLVQNIKFQLASAATLFFIMVIWVVIFAKHGLDEDIPAFGRDQSTLVGFVLNNFAFITTVPSFINELSRSVSIHRVISYSITICVATYLIVGLTGASSFNMNISSDILATLAASDRNKVLTIIVNILFPISVLVTSVPVFAIVIRYNLVRGNICSERQAKFWASWLPWILIIPFQTKGWLLLVMNWTSLIFGASTNFIIPLLFYIASKSHSARAANATGALAPGDVFYLYDDSGSGRSTHIVQRERDRLPAIITSSVDASSLTQAIPTPPVLNVYPPSPTQQETLNRANTVKDAAEEDELANQDISGSSLDPSSIPLRVIYSPAVSRSSSVTQADQPSILLSQPESSDDTQIIPSDSPQSGLRIRSNSFEARAPSEGTVHRRNLSRNNSSESSNDRATLSTEGTAPGAQTAILGSNNRHRRLTIEEVAEDSDDHGNTAVFTAFSKKKWFDSLKVAKIALALVTTAVMGNLIYAIIATAKGENPLSS